MVPTPVFMLVFAPEVASHLKYIDRKYHSLIRRAIDEQLKYIPALITRNRKFLKQPAPFEASWELRFGPGNRFRVFYDVDDNERIVPILAIGIKEGNRLIVSGEEFEP